MTNSKTTKKALLTSMLSLLLCCAMLIGTTFAWFTDSVSSVNNIITAGNLDVELEYSTDGENWTPVTEDTSIFSEDSLWEPGHVEAVALRIKNAGTLALKYNLATTVYEEVGSINVNEEEFKLSDYLVVGHSPIQQDGMVGDMLMGMILGSREPAGGAIVNQTAFGEYMAQDQELLPGAAHVMALRIEMPASVGNEANYKTGEKAPSIKFGINVVATQYTYEEDSFGKDYDDNAKYYIGTVEDLVDAFNNGGKVTIQDDVEGDGTESIEIPEGVTVDLYLNGHTITNPVSGAPAIINNGTLNVYGSGKIINGVNDTKASHTIVNNGTLVINDGDIGTDDTAGAAVVNHGTTTINGGTFASKQENVKADGLCAYAFINQDGTMTINDANLNGQTHGLFGAYAGKIVVNGGNYTMDGNGGLGCYVVYATGEAEVVLVGGTVNTNSPRSNRVFFVYNNGNWFNADAVATDNITYLGTEIYLNGELQTYPNEAVLVSTFEDLKAALNNGGYINLTDSFDVAENLTVAADTMLFSQGEILTFTNNSKVTVNADTALEIIGVTMDAQGEYSFDDDGSIVYDADARRTTPLLNSGAGSTLVLGQGTVIENVVAKGSAVISANGTADNRATVVLKGATIKDCAGESGTVINVNKASDVIIEEGTVISGNASYNNNNHGIIRVYNAWDAANPSTVTMNGGEINDNYYSGNGMIGLYYGKFIMNGGEINNNAWFEDNQESNGWYPVIYAHSNSQFVMNGGEITGNTVKYGVINSLNSSVEGALTINGGTITNNIATNNDNKDAFAVVINKARNSLKVSGDADVTGTVYVYYDADGNYLREYYELSEFFAD